MLRKKGLKIWFLWESGFWEKNKDFSQRYQMEYLDLGKTKSIVCILKSPKDLVWIEQRNNYRLIFGQWDCLIGAIFEKNNFYFGLQKHAAPLLSVCSIYLAKTKGLFGELFCMWRGGSRYSCGTRLFVSYGSICTSHMGKPPPSPPPPDIFLQQLSLYISTTFFKFFI